MRATLEKQGAVRCFDLAAVECVSMECLMRFWSRNRDLFADEMLLAERSATIER